ncbi:MAG TPA: Asp-tRNA(Asn)/Glu-tRNA(Gln) amidotransferase subunit GatA, partial [Candidatus Omnitrophota bacterium]|nr:Asp-tRNA(Asn)/Glu-tRNA(Gln) amidotransferase subunit GatA [Candidatus Omnitrophota bacterium]
MKLHTLTAHEILELYRAKKASIQEVYQAVLAQIERIDKKVNGYIRLNKKPFDFESLKNRSFPLPIAIKDNMCMAGTEITCASHILEGFKSPYDATVIKKLKDAGALIIGNANMDEFAFGSSTENSFYGPTKNPWNLQCVPGGSSGGSAATVAAHEAVWALGSDTGGSIRQPASFCGVVGLKPTYGRVSRYGLIAFASSLDQIGPITKDVADNALLLGIIAGYDPRDSTSANVPVPDYTKSLVKDVKGLKIGIPKEYFIEGLDTQVKEAVMKAADVLKSLGARFNEVSLPHTPYAVATYYIVATAEASSNLARFDGVQYGLRKVPAQRRKSPIVDMYEETRDAGFGAEAKRRIMLGTYSLSSGYYDAYYLRGLKVRTLIKRDFENAFKNFDAILTPTAPTTAFKIGEKTDDPLSMYLSDIYTISANLSGIPAISIPCGFSKEGLPIGLQLMAKPFNEEMLFRIAYAYE